MNYNLVAAAGILAISVSLLTACSPRPSVPSDTPSPAGTVAPSESPVPVATPVPSPDCYPAEPPVSDMDAELSVPEFLSQDMQNLYRQGFSTVRMFCMSSGMIEYFPLTDGSSLDPAEYETVDHNGFTYMISQGRYSYWADFNAMLEGLFTPDCLDELMPADTNTPTFISTEDGRTAFIPADRGGNVSYLGKPETFRLISQDEDHVEFVMTAFYGEDPESQENVFTEEFPIRFERIDNCWKISEFHLPY